MYNKTAMARDSRDFKNISLWLVPEKAQEKALTKTIDGLAKKYGAYSFIPHITVYYLSSSTPLNEAIEGIKKEIKGIKPIEVNAKRVECSEVFIQTLYIRYQTSNLLLKLYKRLDKRFSKNHKYHLNPHLSLIYKNNMPLKDKKLEITKLTYPKILKLDRVMIISGEGSSLSKEKDVLDWKIECESRLSG